MKDMKDMKDMNVLAGWAGQQFRFGRKA